MTQYNEYSQLPGQNDWFRFGNVTKFRPIREESELLFKALLRVGEGELFLLDLALEGCKVGVVGSHLASSGLGTLPENGTNIKDYRTKGYRYSEACRHHLSSYIPSMTGPYHLSSFQFINYFCPCQFESSFQIPKDHWLFQVYFPHAWWYSDSLFLQLLHHAWTSYSVTSKLET